MTETTLTAEQLADLRKLAETATPGPWIRSEDSVAQAPEAGMVCSIAQCCHAIDYGSGRSQTLGYDQNEANAAFIAAASPATVLALIAAAEKLANAQEYAAAAQRRSLEWGEHSCLQRMQVQDVEDQLQAIRQDLLKIGGATNSLEAWQKYDAMEGRAMAATERAAELEAALNTIAEAHIPDQPASVNGDDLSWAQRHVGLLRKIAREALAGSPPAAPAGELKP